MLFRSAPKFRSKQSKYNPHQSQKECVRRQRQILEGRLDASPETKAAVMEGVAARLVEVVEQIGATITDTPELTVVEIPEDRPNQADRNGL